MFDSSVPEPLKQAYSLLKSDKEIHRRGVLRSNTYESLNRDCHLTVAAQAACAPQTRSFVYVSAAAPNILNSKVPFVQRYFSTKKETEDALASFTREELRCVVLRPSVMYDAQHLHTLAPAAVSRVSNLLDRFIFNRVGLQDVPHFLPTPPILVDTVAECAVEAALNPSVHGVLEVEDITRLAEDANTSVYDPDVQELADAMLHKMVV
jgi:nucleoside-diphosphate-sugar epimerase